VSSSPNGNLLTGADGHGLYTLTYDALDRLATQKDMWGLTLTMAYDAVSNRTVLQDSLGGTTTSIYDVANRLTHRQFGGAGQTPLRIDMTYTARDQLATETRYSNLAGTQTVGYSTLTYDAESRLINLDHQNGSGTNLANYTYGYDLANRLTTETLNAGTPITYSYDKTNQLINDSQTAYTYDLNGNRTMSGYQTGRNNQLTNDGTWTYAYDKEGSQISKTKTATGEVELRLRQPHSHDVGHRQKQQRHNPNLCDLRVRRFWEQNRKGCLADWRQHDNDSVRVG
jgi:YD repeat-containing protein